MQGSRRAARMDRRHQRRKMMPGLNMVSLMDIFTILVFFLLVNSAESEIVNQTKAIKLPESVAEEKPRETIVILVNDKDIVVQGRKVALVDDVLRTREDIIKKLKTELDYQAQRQVELLGPHPQGHDVTIMGDRQIPYELLKKIMFTCSKTRFSNISLAVVQKNPGADQS